MLRPQRLVKKQNAEVQSVPAPVGGWNARDSLANMEITDAVQLENMFPTVNSVEIWRVFVVGDGTRFSGREPVHLCWRGY